MPHILDEAVADQPLEGIVEAAATGADLTPPSDVDIMDLMFGAVEAGVEAKAKEAQLTDGGDVAPASTVAAPATPPAVEQVECEFNGRKVLLDKDVADAYNAARGAQSKYDQLMAKQGQPAPAANPTTPSPIPTSSPTIAPISPSIAIPEHLTAAMAQVELAEDMTAGSLSKVVTPLMQAMHQHMATTFINPLIGVLEEQAAVIADYALEKRDSNDQRDIAQYCTARAMAVDPAAVLAYARELQQNAVARGALTEDQAYGSKRGEIMLQAILDVQANYRGKAPAAGALPELKPVAASTGTSTGTTTRARPLPPGGSGGAAPTTAATQQGAPRDAQGRFTNVNDDVSAPSDVTGLALSRLHNLARKSANGSLMS